MSRASIRYIVLALALAACSADLVALPDASPVDAPVCTPGAQVACACVGGALGAQACAADGRSFGACACPDAGAALDVTTLDTGAADVGSPDTGATDVGGRDVAADVLPTGCASTTPGNCCGVACPVPMNATAAACLGGTCGLASCTANYGDCDGRASNGCETDTRTSSAHCGACGAPCAAGRGCVAGACVVCDADGDGATIPACGGMDCDDSDNTRRPGATERCNGLDDDCDGRGDTDLGNSLYLWCNELWRRIRPADTGRAECRFDGTPRTGLPETYRRVTLSCEAQGFSGTTRVCTRFVDTNATWSGCSPRP